MSDAGTDSYDRSWGAPCNAKDHEFAPNENCWRCKWSRFQLQCYAVAILAELGPPPRCRCGQPVRYGWPCEDCQRRVKVDQSLQEGTHLKCHPTDCPICQKNRVRLFCENIGRLSNADAHRANAPYCRGSGNRCGGRATGSDGFCTLHADFEHHHMGDRPNCPDCKDYATKE